MDRYSMGCGDRFGRQGRSQLSAFADAAALNCNVAPVWNKSFREHGIIGTSQADVRQEADAAVRDMGWSGNYYVDADHIGLKNVDSFIEASDFFTIDVADFIGQRAEEIEIGQFVDRHRSLCGTIALPAVEPELLVTEDRLAVIGRTYFKAVKEAARIYSYIQDRKQGEFVVEVSMDESSSPQGPDELLFILKELGHRGVPVQTVAPKFSGRFNKGVEYVGDASAFEQEFDADTAVIEYAVREFGLPRSLKLSVHSGSDKFGIYAGINRVLKKRKAGLHLKTAGTTWLEEVAGLASHGGKCLDVAKYIYRQAFGRLDELCRPYATVIDISSDRLPPPETVDTWDETGFLRALRHDQSDELYNADLRQLLHVGYKVAAEMGDEYLAALDEAEASVGRLVKGNLLHKHILPVFG